MEITHRQVDGLLLVQATGRLDGSWSEHLSQALDELMRAGHDRVLLEMGSIDYISSLGLRSLLGAFKKFKAVGGSFAIIDPSPNVLEVLEMAGLAAMLLSGRGATAVASVPIEAPAAAATAAAAAAEPIAQPFTHASVRGEQYLSGGPGLRGKAYGDPANLSSAAFVNADNHALKVSPDLLALGLGAFGEGYADCATHYGEFLAVAGAAVYQPGDGSKTCDTLLTEGGYVPEVQSLYGLACRGAFTSLARFEPAEGTDHVPLQDLATLALDMAQADVAVVVIAGESAGLIGAALRRSPTNPPAGAATDPFDFPGIRQWLSFTTERAHIRSSVVVCGVVARAGAVPPALAPFLRPLNAQNNVAAHLHAAVFRFRALPRGAVQVADVVRPWFEHETVQDVMHLLTDDREDGAMGGSTFTRGALWCAPLTLEEGT